MIRLQAVLRVVQVTTLVGGVLVTDQCSGDGSSPAPSSSASSKPSTASPGMRSVNGKVVCKNKSSSAVITPANATMDTTGPIGLVPDKQDGSASFKVQLPESINRYTISFECGKATYQSEGNSVLTAITHTCTIKAGKCD